MPLLLAELQDRFRAAVLGFAVGDALGFPYRGLPPQSRSRLRDVTEEFASKPRARFAKGQFSDDTQVMLALAESVAREKKIDGKSAAAHLAYLWQEGVILQAPASLTHAAEALIRGTPWMAAGAPVGVRDPSCLSRGLVVGLWSSDAGPVRLAHDAGVFTVLTHKDPVCSAAVAAYARAVQICLSGEPFTPQFFCEQVATAASSCDADFGDELFYLTRALSWDPDRALAALRRISVSQAVLDAEPGLPAHVAPVLLTAFYAVLKVPHDFRQALSLVLHAGGEVDIATAITASLMGANLGAEAIPARLRKNVLYGEELIASADRLFDSRLAKHPVPVTQLAVVKR
jgi:ADP-ribosyl-[dinitrogen reductase] hydrolase